MIGTVGMQESVYREGGLGPARSFGGSSRSYGLFTYLKRWLLAALAVCTLVIASGGLYERLAPSSGSSKVAARIYVVKQGDTLYSIAERFCGNQYLQEYLYKLEEETGGSTSIFPGERLVLPAG